MPEKKKTVTMTRVVKVHITAATPSGPKTDWYQ